MSIQSMKDQCNEKQQALSDQISKLKSVEQENDQLRSQIQQLEENIKSNEAKFVQKKSSLANVIEVIKSSLRELKEKNN